MKLASKNRVGGMVVNAFLPSKIVTFMGKGGLLKQNCLGGLQWGDKLSALLGGNALICAGDAAMSVQRVSDVVVGQPKHQLHMRPNL